MRSLWSPEAVYVRIKLYMLPMDEGLAPSRTAGNPKWKCPTELDREEASSCWVPAPSVRHCRLLLPKRPQTLPTCALASELPHPKFGCPAQAVRMRAEYLWNSLPLTCSPRRQAQASIFYFSWNFSEEKGNKNNKNEKKKSRNLNFKAPPILTFSWILSFLLAHLRFHLKQSWAFSGVLVLSRLAPRTGQTLHTQSRRQHRWKLHPAVFDLGP